MPAERSVTVKLKLDNSDFNRGLAQAAAAAKAFQKSLNDSSGGADDLDSSLGDVAQTSDDAATSMDDATSSSNDLGTSLGRTGKTADQFSADMAEATRSTRDLADSNKGLLGSIDRSSASMGDAAGNSRELAVAETRVADATNKHERALLDLADAEKKARAAASGSSTPTGDPSRAILDRNAAQIKAAKSANDLALAEKRLGEVQANAASSTLDRAVAENKVADATNKHERALLGLANAEEKLREATTSGSSTAGADPTRAILDRDAAQVKATKSAISLADAESKLRDANDRLNKSFGDGDDGGRGLLSGFGGRADRIQTIVQAVLAIAPAAIPLIAGTAGALTGLSTAMLGAGTAAGSMVLAFGGVGDAMKAVTEYKLDPSIKNFDKMSEAMGKLGPAGQDFVIFLQDLKPELNDLQNVAQDNLFPSLQKGIEGVMDLMPQVERIVAASSKGLGDLAIDAADALKNDQWTEFFKYLETDATDAMDTFARTMGNFAEGLGSLLVGMDPLSDDFNEGLLRMSRDFSDWADTFDETAGFQKFVEWMREVGPQLLDTLGAISSAILDLGEAWAPMAGPTLQIIEGMMEALSAILDTPIGPVLLGIATAVGTLSTAMRVGNWVGGSAVVGLLKNLSATGPSAGVGATAAGTGMTKLGIGMGTMVRGAAGLAGVSLLLSDFDDGMALENTATFGLLGTAAGGPWGAAIGTVTGLIMDAAGANDNFSDAVSSASRAIDAQEVTFDSVIPSIEAARDEFKALETDLTAGGASWGDPLEPLRNLFDPGVVKNNIEGIFGSSDLEEAAGDFKMLALQQGAAIVKQETLKSTYSAFINATSGGGIVDYTNDIAALEKAAAQAAPVLKKMGSTPLEMEKAHLDGGIYWENFMTRFNDAAKQMDSAKGRAEGVGDAIADLGNDAIRTADSAATLATALDALFSPQQGLIAATDTYVGSLRNLGEELAKNKTLQGFSNAAIQNRTAVSTLVDNLKAVMVAQADAGAGSKRLATTLENGRERILNYGRAAGLSGEELRGLLKQMGLTPKLITMVLRSQGIEEAEQQARNLKESVQTLPKDVKMYLKANGVPETKQDMQDVRDLGEKLSKVDVKILAQLKDEATPKVKELLQKVLSLPKDVQMYLKTKGVPETKKELQDLQAKVGKLSKSDLKILAELRDEASPKVKELLGKLLRLPKDVRMWIKTNGVPETKKDLRDLQDATSKLSKSDLKILAELRDEASPKVKKILREMGVLGRAKVKPSAYLDTSPFDRSMGAARNDIDSFNRKKPTPTADLDSRPFNTGIGNAVGRLNMFDRGKAVPNADLDSGPFDAGIRAADGKLGSFDRSKGTAAADLDDNASAKIASVSAKLNALDGNRARTYIDNFETTHIKTVSTSVQRGLSGLFGADGMMLDFYAGGGIRPIGPERPRIEPNRGPGGIVWAETGAGPWEAFISGHPAKKERSRTIADETVGRLGGDIKWMADGGDLRYDSRARARGATAGPSVAQRGSGAEVARLAQAVDRLASRGPTRVVLDAGGGKTLTGWIDNRIDGSANLASTVGRQR